MIIHSVILHNIRSYLDQKIEFPEGSTLLSGDIGCGKSSILLAIEFALFGLKRKSLAAHSLLRNGKKEGFVELKFSINDKEFTIKRNLKRQKDNILQSSGYVLAGNIKKELTPVELKDFILNLLGYPRELLTKKDLIYRYTVYTPQEEMKQILLDEPDNRLDTLRKIFGIDKYKKIKENTSFLIKELKDKKSKFEGHTLDLNEKLKQKQKLEKDMVAMEEKMIEMRDVLKKTNSETNQKKGKLRELENKFQRSKNIKSDLEHISKVLDEKKQRKNTILGEIKEIGERINGLEQKHSSIKLTPIPLKTEEELEEEIRGKEGKLNGITKDVEISKERLNNIKEKISLSEKQIEEKTKQSRDLILKRTEISVLLDQIANLKDIDKEIDINLSSITKITTEINIKKIHIDNSKTVIDKIKKLNNCPTCLQDVDKNHKLKITDEEQLKIREHNSRLDELTKIRDLKEKLIKEQKQKHSDMLKKQSSLGILMSEVKQLEEDTKDLVYVKKSFNSLLESKKVIESRISELEMIDTKTLSKTIDNFKKLLYLLRDNKIKQREQHHILVLIKEKNVQKTKLDNELNSLSDYIVEAEKDKKDMVGNLKEFEGVEKDFEKQIVLVEDQLNKEKEVEIKIAEFGNERGNIQKTISLLTKEVDEKQRSKEKIYKISQLQNWLDSYFVSLMSIMEKHVMFSLYSQFDSLFRDWFNQLVEEETITSRLDETFTPVVEQNGYETSIENLSGGEKTSAALAYRLSLNRVVNNIVSTINTKDIIILDEPTDGFSSEQLDKVRDVLEQLNTKQIIIVSHESKIESFVDNVIKIAKDEHVSVVV